ncbi:MAG: hypothetical protein JKY31_01620 [Rhodobacteraceae bacterium]|nr:hypothetical protein [Paracoccaceae bacterium]
MKKWDVVRIYCGFLKQPHDKYCICICPERRWFYFINSEPPQFRKARALAISIENYEAVFLNRVSYVDTTKVEKNLDTDSIDQAITDQDRHCGAIMPTIRERIRGAVGQHNVLTEEELSLIMDM